jgi:hypothetical protein
MITKRGAAALLIATAATVPLGAGSASAVAKGNGCPKGYQLVPVSYVLSQSTPGFEKAIVAKDANGDSNLCYKLLPSAIPLFEPTFEYQDNTVPVH